MHYPYKIQRYNVTMEHVTKQKGLQKLDYKVFKYATILLVALVIPFNAVHEFGHLIPCWLSGFEGDMSVGLMGSYAVCNGLQGEQIYFISGGLLAFFVAFAPLTVSKLRSNPTVAIVLSSFGIGHLLTAVLETFARDFYMSSEATIIVSLISFTIFGVMLALLGKTDVEENQIGNRRGLLQK